MCVCILAEYVNIMLSLILIILGLQIVAERAFPYLADGKQIPLTASKVSFKGGQENLLSILLSIWMKSIFDSSKAENVKIGV